jgi:hypothetical protein
MTPAPWRPPHAAEASRRSPRRSRRRSGSARAGTQGAAPGPAASAERAQRAEGERRAGGAGPPRRRDPLGAGPPRRRDPLMGGDPAATQRCDTLLRTSCARAAPPAARAPGGGSPLKSAAARA